VRFGHSGRLGDIVFHLAAIRQMGGGDLVLFWSDVCQVGPAEAAALLPLLARQPYVRSARWQPAWDGLGLNLDGWRAHLRPDLNLADGLARWLGLPYWPREDPWLEVPDPRPVAPVVFARALRRQNPAFPWRRAWEAYADRAAFVGLPDEHAAFEREVGPVRFEPTPDLYEAARVIAACHLFVGSQSCLHAVAEGLKRPIVLEVPPDGLTTHYHRRHAWYVAGPADCLPLAYGHPAAPERRVISFALWGSDPKYLDGAIENVHEAGRVYPGWTCRFYAAADCPGLAALRDLPCEVVEMPPPARPDCFSGLFWRFLATADPAVDRALFRDADSRVSEKEAAAVEEWVASGLPVHVLHDCPGHDRRLMPTGLWGCVRGAVPDLAARADRWRRRRPHWPKAAAGDEEFMDQEVWPLVADRSLRHGRLGRPFPPHPPLRHGTYVGDIIAPGGGGAVV
jgi:hypothetical protein